MRQLVEAVPVLTMMLTGVCVIICVVFAQVHQKNIENVVCGAMFEFAAVVIFLEGDYAATTLAFIAGAMMVGRGVYPRLEHTQILRYMIRVFNLLWMVLCFWRATSYLPLTNNSTQNVTIFFTMCIVALWNIYDLVR